MQKHRKNSKQKKREEIQKKRENFAKKPNKEGVSIGKTQVNGP